METLTFNADTARLLDLVVHSLYTRPDVFLRELISNACDALDRYRLESMRDGNVPDAAPLEIRLAVDVQNRTLTIADNGVGMSRAEVVEHIGTIARSGTREFQAAVSATPHGRSEATDLIGRFGVGFYSCFMVADRVTLDTRRAGEEAGTRLESAGDVHYTVGEAPGLPRGTSVTLHLKPVDEAAGIDDYTNRWVLSRVVKRYADFVTYPIVYSGPSAEVPDPSRGEEPKGDCTAVLNTMRPIWMRPESTLTDDDYTEFYRHIGQDQEPPLLRIRARAEGVWEYSTLLFVPARAPYDLYYHGVSFGLQLYSHRMLVAATAEELLPRYLRFLKGVIDVADMPLNVSRQSLQQTHHVANIRRWIARKAIDALDHLRTTDASKYATLWRQFGRAIKEGVSEDRENHERLLPLLLFESSFDAASPTSLDAYVSRMEPGQRDIFYLGGESRTGIEQSPHIEALRAKGYEVLYFTEPVDELVAESLPEFAGHRLRSAAKGDLVIDDGESHASGADDARADSDRLAGLVALMSAHLGSRVRTVRASQRLTTSPACLTTAEFELSPHIQRLLKDSGPAPKRTLEINPRHPAVETLWQRFTVDPSDSVLRTATDLLFGCALLAEGTGVPGPAQFTEGVMDLLVRSCGGGVGCDAPATVEVETA